MVGEHTNRSTVDCDTNSCFSSTRMTPRVSSVGNTRVWEDSDSFLDAENITNNWHKKYVHYLLVSSLTFIHDITIKTCI